MNFKFSSYREAVRDTFTKLCREELAPLREPAREPEPFARRLFRRWGDLGLIWVHFSEYAGGSDLNRMISDCIVREELSHFSQAFTSSCFVRAHLNIWSTGHLTDLESRSHLSEKSVSDIGDSWRVNLGVCFE